MEGNRDKGKETKEGFRPSLSHVVLVALAYTSFCLHRLETVQGTLQMSAALVYQFDLVFDKVIGFVIPFNSAIFDLGLACGHFILVLCIQSSLGRCYLRCYLHVLAFVDRVLFCNLVVFIVS